MQKPANGICSVSWCSRRYRIKDWYLGAGVWVYYKCLKECDIHVNITLLNFFGGTHLFFFFEKHIYRYQML